MTKLEERLLELEKFEDNWDGYGGLPVTPQALEAARQFIKVLENTSIGLNSNGGLTFEWEVDRRFFQVVINPDGRQV